MEKIYEMLRSAKAAAPKLAVLDTETKNKALLLMADKLRENAALILKENKKDVERAKSKISDVMIDRLLLTEERIFAMADGICQVRALPDPVGKVQSDFVRPNGLEISRVSVPIGVVAIIYESRPNVTSDAAALCFKSGNVCILRGGSEAYNTSLAIVKVLRSALSELSLDENFIHIPSDTSREAAKLLMEAVGYVDALIPRGGAGLIRACIEESKIPCIQTGTGICHIYVDKDADIEMALNITDNAKTSRPSVCNAAEVCLVHRDIAGEFLPKLKERLVDERVKQGKCAVELRADKAAREIISASAAGPLDFDTEFLDYILAVGVVDSIEGAIEHIAAHSTHHSESIVTEDIAVAEKFLKSVDSAAVYHNASTRFTDGGEFGLGCEIGISTQKLHARGPMGLSELTSYKYVVRGNGQIR